VILYRVIRSVSNPLHQ